MNKSYWIKLVTAYVFGIYCLVGILAAGANLFQFGPIAWSVSVGLAGFVAAIVASEI